MSHLQRDLSPIDLEVYVRYVNLYFNAENK